MNSKLKMVAGVGLAILASAVKISLAQAPEPVKFQNDVLVAANGMTLYTFDKDGPNKSNCNDGCLKAWPALMAPADVKLSGNLSVITRDDGGKQIAMNGKPLYFYVADQKVGDVTGDGSGGVWHAVHSKEGSKEASGQKRAASPAPSSGYSY
jgi:predicted lipoprotein with Yx(FWY)xxD motif